MRDLNHVDFKYCLISAFKAAITATVKYTIEILSSLASLSLRLFPFPREREGERERLGASLYPHQRRQDKNMPDHA